MAFLCTFTGLTVSLIIWVALNTVASNSQNPLLISLAPYLEALSASGQCLFVVLAMIISLLTYRVLRPKANDESSDQTDG